MEATQNPSVEMQLITRAWKDEAFKTRLVSNPREVLREYGEQVPDHLEIKVLEEGGNTRYFVLPQNPTDALESELLTDEALDAVAGGWCSVLGCSTQKEV
ncbi:MAG: NHLP leader peptide family natural product precursor [Ardenticatenales bacterium]|nr:NHLP leader peptide family natural product precursor [Ardenticatenales bacterium]